MPKIDWSSLYKKEDWWALWIGLFLFFLSLPSISKIYLLGWIPGGRSWLDLSKALGFGAAGPADANAWWGLIAVWIFLMIILLPVGKLIGIKPRSWIVGFSVIFWISMALWIACFYTPVLGIFGSSEVGWVFALVIGILLGNMRNLPQSLR